MIGYIVANWGIATFIDILGHHNITLLGCSTVDALFDYLEAHVMSGQFSFVDWCSLRKGS